MSVKEEWEPREEDYLREHYPTVSNRQLAKDLGRTINSIQIKANRLGLVKELEDDEGIDEFENRLETMSREEAKKLDKIDLLAVNWSLLEMYRRELTNPKLSTRARVKLMVALSNHTETISNIMKGSEELLGTEEDLEAAMAKLEARHAKHEASPRRDRGYPDTFVLVRVDEEEDGKDKAERGETPKTSGAGP